MLVVENQVNSISIYTAEGCEVIHNCYVIVLETPHGLNKSWGGGLCYSTDHQGTYKHISDLACVNKNGRYRWFLNNGEITVSVKEWLEHNGYTWPLNAEQQAHFTLTFL